MLKDNIEKRVADRLGEWEMFPRSKRIRAVVLCIELIFEAEPEDLEYLSLNWLARVINVSESYLSRAFTEIYQTSPQEYIFRQKMSLAQCLLQDKKHPSIEEVAQKLHYCNANYFIKVFKKHCGKTPLQYQRQFSVPRAMIKKLKRKIRKQELKEKKKQRAKTRFFFSVVSVLSVAIKISKSNITLNNTKLNTINKSPPSSITESP